MNDAIQQKKFRAKHDMEITIIGRKGNAGAIYLLKKSAYRRMFSIRKAASTKTLTGDAFVEFDNHTRENNERTAKDKWRKRRPTSL